MIGSRRPRTLILAAALAFAASACSQSTKPPTIPTPTVPAHVEVQGLLVGFDSSVAGKTIPRTMAEAESIAMSLLARARAGEDFDTLVQQYTDAEYPGVYRLANTGVEPDSGEYRRILIVKEYADRAFALAVDSLGIAVYNPSSNPYGWFVIKRLQ